MADYSTKQIIDYAMDDNGSEFRNALYASIHDKVTAHIEAKKQEVAENLLGLNGEQSEEQEEEYELEEDEELEEGIKDKIRAANYGRLAARSEKQANKTKPGGVSVYDADKGAKADERADKAKKLRGEEVELTESLIFQNETPTKHSRVTHSAFVKTHSGHLHVGDIQHGKDITGNGHDYYVSHVNGEDGGAHTEHEAKQLMHKFHKNHLKSGYRLNSASIEEEVEELDEMDSYPHPDSKEGKDLLKNMKKLKKNSVKPSKDIKMPSTKETLGNISKSFSKMK
jgi:hypothetical protein